MVNQRNLIYGRDAITGELVPFANNRGALDVFIQDQNTPIVNWILHQDLNDVTLVEHTTVNSNTLNLQAGHNFVTGNLLVLLQDDKFYQGIVTNVNVNQITVDVPFDKQFRIDRPNLIATRSNPNVAVNGSLTNVTFHALPAQLLKWDLMQLVIYIVDDVNAMDDTTLGGIAAVTNGIVLRKKNTVYDNIGNAKKNGDFKAQGCEVIYASKIGGGEASMNAICKFSEDAGVTLRIDGTESEEVELIVQDDLSAITSITAVVIGHIVE